MSSEVELLLQSIASFETGRALDRSAFPLVFVESVRFERWDDGAESPTAVDATFEAWLSGLRDRGAQRLELAEPGINAPGNLPGRMTFGFSNASGAFLVASGHATERWRARWEVGDQRAADRRIWRLTFQGVGHPHEPGVPMLSDPPPVEQAADRLAAALEAVHSLALRIGLRPWPEFFGRALLIAKSDPAAPPAETAYRGALTLPDAWRSPAAIRLLRAASASNGFGAMGSWNDQSPVDAERASYEQQSQELFVAMLAAWVAGANER